jgi:hypothetical protein
MTVEAEGPVKIDDYLAEGLTVGEPRVTGSVAVYPLFGRDPRLEYITLARALPLGFVVKEVPGSGSVRDLIVHNPTDTPVLLFEGEEVIGAQQNRTFDSSVLVGARDEMTVHVSCVEAGRWDGRRNAERFTRAEQMAYPEMRREKARQANRARLSAMEARADQGEVWNEVSRRSRELGVESSTGSINDVYESRRSTLRGMAGSIPIREGQVGSVLQIGSRIQTLDLVSRPDAYTDLHEALVQGYCLDGMTPANCELTAEPSVEATNEFIERVLATNVLERDGLGLGRDFRFESDSLVGSGLVSGQELIQLSVFADDPDTDQDGGRHHRTRINRPSHRNR